MPAVHAAGSFAGRVLRLNVNPRAGLSRLHRGDTQIGENDIGGRQLFGRQHTREPGEIAAPDDQRAVGSTVRAQARVGYWQLDRIDIERQHSSARRHSLEERSGVAAIPEIASTANSPGRGDRTSRISCTMIGRCIPAGVSGGEHFRHLAGVLLRVPFLVLCANVRGCEPGYRVRLAGLSRGTSAMGWTITLHGMTGVASLQPEGFVQ